MAEALIMRELKVSSHEVLQLSDLRRLVAETQEWDDSSEVRTDIDSDAYYWVSVRSGGEA